jgi:hypothetical protein
MPAILLDRYLNTNPAKVSGIGDTNATKRKNPCATAAQGGETIFSLNTFAWSLHSPANATAVKEFLIG